MLDEAIISQHYTHGNLLGAIEGSVSKLGKTTGNITVDDLAPVDEFHIGSRIATAHLLDQLQYSKTDRILDIGCGLGGAARYVASNYGCQVDGIDLTPEYIDTGNTLCGWVGLDQQVKLHQGSALALPFEDENFDGAFMLHVGMNIDDKVALFKEVSRVLKPGARFGVYDIMRIEEGEVPYPMTWAPDAGTSSLATPDAYRDALEQAGFSVSAEANRRDFALEFFKQMQEKVKANGGPPPLGLHTLMQDSTPVKLKNLVDSIAAGLIAPVEIIGQKS
ncbi:MAG: methyltransferase domain-containing protein [Acidiferrobacterales bacterium]|nr:methyltransferase domain-containing protein [Acidiferrobacterales bacterium]